MHLSATGKPFSDADAAAVKAAIMSRETGMGFIVAPHPLGGFCVVPATGDDLPGADLSMRPDGTPERGIPSLFVEPTVPHPNARESLPTKHASSKNPKRPFHPPEAGDSSPASKSHYPEVIKLHPSWMSHLIDIVGLVISVLLILAPGGVAVLVVDLNDPTLQGLDPVPWFRWTGMGLSVFLLWRIFKDILAHRYQVDRKEVRASIGLLARRINEVQINHIRAIDVEQKFFERLLDIGTLKIASAGTAGDEVVFLRIDAPEKLREEIQSRTTKHEHAAD